MLIVQICQRISSARCGSSARRKWFCICFIIGLLGFSSWANAATRSAASVSLADVQAAYNSSSDGDTISIPAGTATWSGSLTVAKGVSIIGAGTNATVISRAGKVFHVSPGAGKAVRISNMKLDIGGYYGGGNYPIEVATSETDTNSPIYVRIDHIFMNYGQYSITFVGCNAWGVIDHCTFYNQSMAIQMAGGAPVWSYPRTAGTTNTLVVEDCRFYVDNNAPGKANWDEQETFSTGHGIRLAVRNCLVDWTAYTSGNGLPYEQHGKGGTISSSPPSSFDLRGPPVVELYSNVFKVYNTYRMMNLRGGQNLVYSNVFTAAVDGGNVINLTEDNYDSSYMGVDQIANSFFWANTYNGSAVSPILQDGDDAAYIQINRNYFTHAPDSSSGIITWSDWDGSHNGTFTGSTAQKFYPYTALAYPHPVVTAQDGGGGAVTSNAPSITAQPVAVTNSTTVGFGVGVTVAGDGTLVYQWRRNSVNLSGATSATYTQSPATTNQSGGYSCLITSVYGSITSSVAYVSITNTAAGGAGFYVSRTLGNDSNAGTLASPWATIGKANTAAVAGNTVYILAGKYNQGINPGASGTSGAPITFRNYNTDSVTITGAVVGVTIASKQFITVSGLNFTNVSRFASLSSASNNTITNCTFMGQLGASYWGGLALYASSRSNLIINCTLSRWGSTSPSSDGDMIDIGGDASDLSYYNRVEGCTLTASGHALVNLRCGYNVLRGNWGHNDAWSGGYGHRGFIIDADPDLPGGYNLIESNRLSFADHSVDGGANNGIDLRTRFNIVRFNTFFNNQDVGVMLAGGGTQVDQAIYNHIYNNTFYSNGLDGSGSDAAIGMQTYGAPFIVKTNSLFNNLFWKHGTSYWNSGANAALNLQIRSNNWEQTSDPKFTDVATAYTATTVGKPDLTLQSVSPCIDAGAFLTKVTSASSSGTSFTVADPWFFQAGLAGIGGDRVQLRGQSGTARITSISGSTITVDASLTWTNGQGIALPYSGSAPDIGAYEYQTGGAQPTPPTNLRIASVP